MSLGGGASSALDTAINNSINSGVTYAVAAGNSNANACNASPARAPAAITVGATTASDARASYSNYGSCLDIFAPGSGITSAWYTSTTASNTISGTSMASPHVAGAAALYLETNRAALPAAVRTQLVVNTATPGKVTGAGTGSPNLLLYTGTGGNPPPPPPTTCANEPFSGSITTAGGSVYHTSTAGFQAVAGAHKGCLTGPDGTDYDLYLQRYSNGRWGNVASGTSSRNTETVTYNGSAGLYRWRVHAYSGTGAYTLELTRPL